MSDEVELSADQYRLVVAIQYFNASEAICKGLQTQQRVNDFHFLVTLRSFIEYTRRGIWFLAWASEEQLLKARTLTFREAGSPRLAKMDAMLNKALGQSEVSRLMDIVPVINEPFLHCLHALTHGNPISVRMMAKGLANIFNTSGLLRRAEMELGVFRILLYRRILGEDFSPIWELLATMHNRPEEVRANETIATQKLHESGKVKDALGFKMS